MTNAPWNPRTISKEAKKRLKKVIEKYGLVAAFVWNEKTGHIIGGHQRVSILDSIEKNKDYLIDVCVLSVEEKEEMAINVMLNNQDAMGEFDFGALQDLQQLFNFDPMSDFAFSEEMTEINFPDFNFKTEKEDDSKTKVLSPEDIQLIKENKREGRKKIKENENEYGTYRTEAKGSVILVFSGETQKRRWLNSIGADESSRVLMAEDVLELKDIK